LPYELQTKTEKLVIDYTGLNLFDVQDLDVDIFLFFVREAYIYERSKTEEGREYLQNCWRIGQTKADRKAIREKIREQGG
jgi:hypothetical protein